MSLEGMFLRWKERHKSAAYDPNEPTRFNYDKAVSAEDFAKRFKRMEKDPNEVERAETEIKRREAHTTDLYTRSQEEAVKFNREYSRLLAEAEKARLAAENFKKEFLSSKGTI